MLNILFFFVLNISIQKHKFIPKKDINFTYYCKKFKFYLYEKVIYSSNNDCFGFVKRAKCVHAKRYF